MGPCSLLPVTLPVLFFLICWSLKMKALWSFRMFVTTYQMTQHNNPVDWNFSTVLVVLLCISWSRVILSRKVLFSETLTVRKRPIQPVCCLWCSIMMAVETFEMRKYIFTISSTKPQKNTEEILKTYEFLTYGDIHYIAS